MVCQVGNGAPKAVRVDDVEQHFEGRDDIEAHRIGQRQRRYTYIGLSNQIVGELCPESLNARLSKIQSSHTAYSMLTPEFQPDARTRPDVENRATCQIGKPIVTQGQFKLDHPQAILLLYKAR